MAKQKASTEPKTVISPESQADFENFGNLVAIVDEGTARLDMLQNEINDVIRDEIDMRRTEVTELQASIIEAKKAGESLCKKHRHWFGGKQSLTLLHGTASFRASSSLLVPNEIAAIALIKATASAEDAKRLIRTVEELDKEALEKLDDATLAKFGITRVESETFDIKPRKVDLAKTVAAMPKNEEKEAA